MFTINKCLRIFVFFFFILDMRIVASAPGKLILAGEHSVVYGEPALATAIDLRTTVEIDTEVEQGEKLIFVDLHSFDIKDVIIRYYGNRFHSELLSKTTGHTSQVQNSIQAIVSALNKVAISQPLSCRISVTSSIPTGCGLGSSAAFSVALSAAVMQLSGSYATPLHELANQIESTFHDNPSGIDTFVSQNGGLVEFQRAESSFVTKNVEICDNVKGVVVQIVNTNVTRSTKSMVGKVRRAHEKNREFAVHCCKAITALVYEFKDKLQGGDIDGVQDTMEKNHLLLNAIGVGHSGLDFAHVLARDKYNTILKTTGAGGGGCMFSLKPLPNQLIQELNAKHYTTFRTSIMAAGLSIDVS